MRCCFNLCFPCLLLLFQCKEFHQPVYTIFLNTLRIILPPNECICILYAFWFQNTFQKNYIPKRYSRIHFSWLLLKVIVISDKILFFLEYHNLKLTAISNNLRHRMLLIRLKLKHQDIQLNTQASHLRQKVSLDHPKATGLTPAADLHSWMRLSSTWQQYWK